MDAEPATQGPMQSPDPQVGRNSHVPFLAAHFIWLTEMVLPNPKPIVPEQQSS